MACRLLPRLREVRSRNGIPLSQVPEEAEVRRPVRRSEGALPQLQRGAEGHGVAGADDVQEQELRGQWINYSLLKRRRRGPGCRPPWSTNGATSGVWPTIVSAARASAGRSSSS